MSHMSAAPDPAAPATHRERGDSLLTWVLLGSGLLHLLAVLGQQAFVYVDSVDYETLDFTGGSRRPWVTPLLYHLVDDHSLRIAFQGGISALCWGYLALQVARCAVDVRVQWALLLSVLTLSLTTTVTNWDTAMLSESLALSFTALVLGAVLRFVAEPRGRTTAVLLVAWVLWIWTRQNHLVISILATGAVALVVAVRLARRSGVARPLAVAVGGIALVTALAGTTYGNNTEILHFNLAMVIGGRVLPDAERTHWYLDHGMPLADGAVIGQGRGPQDLLNDPQFERWVAEDGVRTYAQDLLAHPWRTATEPLDDLVGDRPPFGETGRPDEVLLAGPDSYGIGREVLPGQLEDLVFQPGNAGLVVLLFVVVVGWTLAEWRARGFDRRWGMPLLVLAVQVPALWAVYYASTAELGRLALPSALIVRIVLFLQLGLLVDRRWTGLADPAALPAEPADPPAGDPA